MGVVTMSLVPCVVPLVPRVLPLVPCVLPLVPYDNRRQWLEVPQEPDLRDDIPACSLGRRARPHVPFPCPFPWARFSSWVSLFTWFAFVLSSLQVWVPPLPVVLSIPTPRPNGDRAHGSDAWPKGVEVGGW